MKLCTAVVPHDTFPPSSSLQSFSACILRSFVFPHVPCHSVLSVPPSLWWRPLRAKVVCCLGTDPHVGHSFGPRLQIARHISPSRRLSCRTVLCFLSRIAIFSCPCSSQYCIACRKTSLALRSRAVESCLCARHGFVALGRKYALPHGWFRSLMPTVSPMARFFACLRNADIRSMCVVPVLCVRV
ncbi:hypothetical protein BCV70DRAFT_53053 [Testicularia cyperi]|uniref:Uncharacterized protein n=1 Tax=Testicularia cyperi TaxID=1882483 RepID=A0A317XVF3_9BASI|nr:hypothetical protein BCV70DRAFT_53053 [Testicularia cyperi]